MKITISIASKTLINPLKRAGVKLGQNWGGNRHTDEGKTGVKWGWKSTRVLDESLIKLGWKSPKSDPDKRRTESVQASVWRRGRDGINREGSLGKGLYNRRPKGDQKLQWFCSKSAVELSQCSLTSSNLETTVVGG